MLCLAHSGIYTDTFRVPVWVVPGTISFPRQPDSSVIMVGPGTGCAPFRAYVEERVAQEAHGEVQWEIELGYVTMTTPWHSGTLISWC